MTKIRQLILPGAFALAAFCALVSLGVWQVKRLHWKEALIATVESRISQEPIPFEQYWTAQRSANQIEYVPVKLEGSFLHQHERHYYATHEGQTGWHVFTPLLLDEGSAVFVNRGFVPYDMKEAASRQETLIAGVVEISGLIRVPPDSKPNIFTPDNDPVGNEFYWHDFDSMVESSGLPANHSVIPLFVDADASMPGEYPKGGTTQLSFPNNHLQYAGTWFGLAIVLLVVFVVFARSRLKQNGA